MMDDVTRYAKGTRVFAIGPEWTITEHVVVSDNGLPSLNLEMADGSRKSSREVSLDRAQVVQAAIHDAQAALDRITADVERQRALIAHLERRLSALRGEESRGDA